MREAAERMETAERHTMIKLQVDPLTLVSLAAFLAAAVYLLSEVFELFMLGRKRRKRSQIQSSQQTCSVLEGKNHFLSLFRVL